ncbi:MAG: hypothetical protein CSA20_00280 [Deltaproteobacteria bacterium]|nr:MAG: hypothetical protein CSA20_00280 [Deltaproteobacteria bacterium]
MLGFARYSLGVDIGTEGAALVLLKADSRKTQLVGHEYVALDAALPVAEKVSSLVPCLEEFCKRYKVEDPQTQVCVPSGLAIVRFLRFPRSVKENLNETLSYEIEKYIPYGVDDIYFDAQVVKEHREEGTVEVLVVAVKKTEFDPYFLLRNAVGSLASVEIGLTALALPRWDGGRQESKEFFLVNREDGRCSLSLVAEGKVVSSHIVAADESGSYTAVRFHDEAAKVCERRNLDPAGLDVFYVAATDREKDFFSGGSADGLLCYPFAAALPAMTLLKAALLAGKGLREDSEGVNLLPEKLRKKPNRTALYVSFGLLASVVLLSCVLVGTVVLQKRWQQDRLQAEVARLDAATRDIAALEEKKTAVEQRVAFLQREERQAPVLLDALNELSVLLPDSIFLQGFTLRNNEVRINGVAESAVDLINDLERSALFYDVAFLTTVRKDKQGKEIFTVGFSLQQQD